MDTQIEAAADYGSSGGTAIELVIQNILDGTPSGMGVPTVYTPVSPVAYRTVFTLEPAKVLEAARQIAQDIGWDARFRYDAAGVSRFTFYDPDRDRVTVDTTFGPTEYLNVEQMALRLADIRNAGKLYYYDTSGVEQSVTASDAGSIALHGRRFFQIPPQAGIDTSTEAQKLIDAAVHDLAGPGAEQTVTTLYFWPAQLFDRYTFLANGVHYDTDQTLAVVAYQHTLQGGVILTTLTCTLRIVGAYAEWRRRGAVVPPDTGDSSVGLLEVVATPHADRDTITWSSTGVVEYYLNGVLTTLPASPFDVYRNPAGGLPKLLFFRATLGTQEATEGFSVLPVDSDTVTPDIQITPTGQTATTQSFSAQGVNPKTSSYTTVTIYFTGCSGTVNGTPVADGGSLAVAGGPATVVANRPALGSPPGTVRAIATVSGGGTAFATRTVSEQTADFTAPTLEVTAAQLSDRVTFSYSSSGSVYYRIDGGSWTLATGTFDVFRNNPGADKTVQFKAVGSNGIVTGPQAFDVAAVPSTGGGGSTTTAVVDRVFVSSVDTSTDTLNVGWDYAGALGSGYFDVLRVVTLGTSPDLSSAATSFATTAGSTAADSSHGYNLTATGANITFSYMVRVFDVGGNVLRTSSWIHYTTKYT
jgi:hypothetical protein